MTTTLTPAELAAKTALTEISPGREIVVAKGNKVPRGTTGTVFWHGPGDYGPRVGFKDPKGNTHWTSEANVEVTIPGLAPGQAPPGGWVAYQEKVSAAQKAWVASFPKKGEMVRVTKSPSNPILGHVFWVSETRVGVKRKGAPEEEDPVWCDVWEVEILDDLGGSREVSRTPPPILPETSEPDDTTPLPNLITTAPAANGFFDLDLDDENEVDPIAAALLEMSHRPGQVLGVESDPGSGWARGLRTPPRFLANYPAPFNRITEVRDEGGIPNAYDQDGVFIVRLTEKSAHEILGLMLQELSSEGARTP